MIYKHEYEGIGECGHTMHGKILEGENFGK